MAADVHVTTSAFLKAVWFAENLIGLRSLFCNLGPNYCMTSSVLIIW